MRFPPRDPPSTLGTCAASMPGRFNVWRGHYPPQTGSHKAGHLQATLRTCRARQPYALQGSGCAARRGMPWSPRDPPSTLGTCAASKPRRLHVWRWPYPPETGLAQGRPLAGHHDDCEDRKEAACAARRGMPWTSRDPASTLKTCAASMPRRLHVWRWPYP